MNHRLDVSTERPVRCHGSCSLSAKRRQPGTNHGCLSNEDVWTLVESARGEALMEHRRRNLVVSREPSFFLSWTGEQLDMPTCGLLSRVMSVATRSRPVSPPAEASLERETALPVSAQSTPASASVFNVDGFSRVNDEPIRDLLGRTVVVTEDDVFLGDMGVHSRSDGSRVRIAHFADDLVVSWHERRVRVYELFGHTEQVSETQGHHKFC